MRHGSMTKTDWSEVEVEVNIEASDVIDFIDGYATDSDLNRIKESLKIGGLPNATIVDDMKNQLFIKATQKYTLEELETRLEMSYL